jgi:hypothetical protein
MPGSTISPRPSLRRLGVVLAVVGLLGSACTSGDPAPAAEAEPAVDLPPESDPAPTGTWAGTLDESSAFVAVVTSGDQVVAYVCEDGVIGSWFAGAPAAPETELVNAAGHRLALTFGDQVTGSFDDGSSIRSFRTEPRDGEVLFRADAVDGEDPIVGGWIRMGDQTRGTISTKTGIQPAPPLGSEITISPELAARLAPAPMTPDTLGAPTANSTRFVWAAGGDSFASGEGNPERKITDSDDPENFAGLRWGDDASIAVPIPGQTLARDVTTCHRSDEAGAPKANRKLQGLYPNVTFTLGFVACGGAQTVDMVQNGYLGPSSTPASRLGAAPLAQPAQLDRIAGFRTAQGRLDALYLSVGGNDMGFGPMIEACIDPLQLVGDCVDEADVQLTTKAAEVAGGYAAIEGRLDEHFGDALPVLISAYPNPVHDQSSAESPPVCLGADYDRHGETGIGGFDDALRNNITADEALFAFGISGRINVAVSAAASAHGWTVVDDHLQASQGHGLCTDSPFFNLNSVALRSQGRDIPDTAFLLFSGGLLHPNDAGFTRYGDAIVADLRPVVDGVVRTGLAAPTNVRIAAASDGGPITVRWNDRATSENAYDVEVLPTRPQDQAMVNIPPGSTQLAGGGFVRRVTGSGVQELVHVPNGPGRFTYRVRACQSGVSAGAACGPYSAPITGVNSRPGAVAGVQASPTNQIVAGRPTLATRISWTAQVDAIEYVVRIESTTDSFPPVFVRTPTPSLTRNLTTGAPRYRVAACNRVGCSSFGTAVS